MKEKILEKNSSSFEGRGGANPTSFLVPVLSSLALKMSNRTESMDKSDKATGRNRLGSRLHVSMKSGYEMKTEPIKCGWLLNKTDQWRDGL